MRLYMCTFKSYTRDYICEKSSIFKCLAGAGRREAESVLDFKVIQILKKYRFYSNYYIYIYSAGRRETEPVSDIGDNTAGVG